MKKSLLLTAAATLAILGTDAQINSPSADGFLTRAGDMYHDGNYYGCLDQLSMVDRATLTPEQVMYLRYYIAVATVHTDNILARTLLDEFVGDYPASVLRNPALLAYGDCYYGSDYAHALALYKNVDPEALSEARRDDLYYHMAFSYMKLDQPDRALGLFEQLEGSREYAAAARFYQGYIAYSRGNMALAESILLEVDTSRAPGNMADFYLSQIYYGRGDYAKALGVSRNILSRRDIPREFVAEAYRVAGESEYELGNDPQAVKYLLSYVGMTERPMPSALYILGLNAYNKGQYTEAINYMSPVTECDDAMGQSAYLYTGQAYMQQRDYTQAAMAFNRALNMSYDRNVQEVAYYNYAVATMRGGKVPFANTVGIFTNFLKLYPNSKYAPAVQEYVITSYLTDNNYAAALKSINEMSNPSKATLAAKQHVLYALGVKALATAQYTQALEYLTEADSLASYNSDIAREVSLALGEALYRNGRYEEAATRIQRYLTASKPDAENMPVALYDMGYALYARKKYDKALTYFNKLLSGSDSLPAVVTADAWSRLGDCYYYLKDFAKATSAYDKAYAANPDAGDYPLFQKALMDGYQRKYTQKIQALTELQTKFPTSALIPDALLEITESYIQLGDNNKAIETYRRLIDLYPNTAQARQGYLQMALVMQNTGDRAGAVDAYRQLITKYPTSDEARQAVDQMKRIAAADGTLKEFMAFLGGITGAPQIDESDIEVLTFENAEKDYLTENKLEALKSFIEEYPESNYRARALAYLVEGEMAHGDLAAAYDYANALINQYPDNSWIQTGYLAKARVEQAWGHDNRAMRTWRELAAVASSPEILLEARMGIIHNGREAGEFDEVFEAANAVLASSGVGPDDIAEATYSRGLVYESKGLTKEARADWQSIAGNTDNIYGVQSLYKLGESYYNAKDYDTALTWADKLVNSDTPHRYWLARGFILLGDIYAAKGDKYRSRQYLEAVRDYYEGSEADIFQMIDQRLK